MNRVPENGAKSRSSISWHLVSVSGPRYAGQHDFGAHHISPKRAGTSGERFPDDDIGWNSPFFVRINAFAIE
jgi:hypothetical protein